MTDTILQKQVLWLRIAAIALWAPIAGLLAFWAWFDERPVQRSMSRTVTPPSAAKAGSLFALRHKVVRLRDVPTLNVGHFLTQGDQTWPLVQHQGENRSTGENTYHITALWPETAGPGEYRWRVVVRFQCNPIRECAEAYDSEPFEVK